MPIRDVDPLVPCHGMRIDVSRGLDRVFPFFLHFAVHYEEGVVGEVDGDLAFCVWPGGGGLGFGV